MNIGSLTKYIYSLIGPGSLAWLGKPLLVRAEKLKDGSFAQHTNSFVAAQADESNRKPTR